MILNGTKTSCLNRIVKHWNRVVERKVGDGCLKTFKARKFRAHINMSVKGADVFLIFSSIFLNKCLYIKHKTVLACSNVFYGTR